MSLLLDALKELQSRDVAPAPAQAAVATGPATFEESGFASADQVQPAPAGRAVAAGDPCDESHAEVEAESFCLDAGAEPLATDIETIEIPPERSFADVVVVETPRDDVLPETVASPSPAGDRNDSAASAERSRTPVEAVEERGQTPLMKGADPLLPQPSARPANVDNALPSVARSASQAAAFSPARRLETDYESGVRRNLDDQAVRDAYQKTLDGIAELLPSELPIVATVVAVERDEHTPDLVAHLGLLRAQSQSDRVLLVDANLTEKTLTQRFGQAGESGLADALNRRQGWRPLVVATSTPRLHFLPAGRGVSGTSEGDHTRLASLVAQWKQQYRFVLIESGTAGGPLSTLLAHTCDATFVIVRLGQTGVDEASGAVFQLRSAGGRLMGCIVTEEDCRPVPQSRAARLLAAAGLPESGKRNLATTSLD